MLPRILSFITALAALLFVFSSVWAVLIITHQG